MARAGTRVASLGLALLAGGLAAAPQQATRPAQARVVLIRDAHASFEIFERELRRAYAGPIAESVVLTRNARALPGSLQKLDRSDIVVTVGRRATSMLAKSKAPSGPLRCVARHVAVAPRDLRGASDYDSFLAIQVPAALRLESLLKKIPEVARVGVLLPPGARELERALRSVERVARRDLLEFQSVRAAHECVGALARFGPEVEIVMLMPDGRSAPRRGSRLELEFLREVVKRDLWLVTFDHRQLESRTVLSIEPDFVALARCLARGMGLARSKRGRELHCDEVLLRAVPDKLRRLRDKRKR